jgi:hypothetical protein
MLVVLVVLLLRGPSTSSSGVPQPVLVSDEELKLARWQ